MTHFDLNAPAQLGPVRPNASAMLVAIAAVGLLYLDFDPTPAGADTDRAQALVVDETPLPSVAPIAEDAAVTAFDEAAIPASVDELLAGNPETLRGAKAVALEIALLEAGAALLERVPDYTATFCKQESQGGALGDDQQMFVKIRHEPFSVYMKWLNGDKGREVLYVDGENEGRMLVHAGGWKARLLPVLKLDPNGSLALSEARHPITSAGLLQLTEKLLDHRRADLQRGSGVRCQMINHQAFQSRACYCFVVEYDSPEVSETYRKSVTLIDKELSLPVCIRNYGWPAGKKALASNVDGETLLEFYRYTDIRLRQQLADADFDRSNGEYTFRR